MNDVILIIGRSIAARVALPALLAEQRCTVVCVDDALSAMHVLERLRADFIVADIEASRMTANALAAARTRAPHLAETPLRVLRTGDERAMADEVLARTLAAWKSEHVPSDDMRVVLPAMLSCVERAAA